MMTELEQPQDELRYLTSALREWVLWQQASGAHGLPRAEPSALPSVEPSREPVEQPMPRPTVRKPEPIHIEPLLEPERTVVAPSRPEKIELSAEERRERLKAMAETAGQCTRCSLHSGRTNVVYGIGPVDVEIMIVGEGPGVDEDAQGEPFVGKAGQLLDRMLAAMGFNRNEIYIGNAVKCRPPNNRVPEDDEMASCLPYLREQIELVRPKILLAMGATACKALLGMGGITRIRGKWKLYQGSIPLMPTFHPAYLLRNEAAKKDVWADLKDVMKHLKREIPKSR